MRIYLLVTSRREERSPLVGGSGKTSVDSRLPGLPGLRREHARPTRKHRPALRCFRWSPANRGVPIASATPFQTVAVRREPSRPMLFSSCSKRPQFRVRRRHRRLRRRHRILARPGPGTGGLFE